MATWTSWGASSGTWDSWDTWNGPGQGVSRYFLVSPRRETGAKSADPYFELTRHFRGVTVVKRDGTWQQVRNKRQDWLDTCDVVLRGGYDNEVTEAQKTELEALGYLIETRTS